MQDEVPSSQPELRSREDAFTPGSAFRFAVIRDREHLSLASAPHLHDRLLVVFCLIALGTLLAVAFYLLLG